MEQRTKANPNEYPYPLSLETISGIVERFGPVPMERVKLATVIAALRTNKGYISRTARYLGIGRTTLYRYVRKYNLTVTRDAVTIDTKAPATLTDYEPTSTWHEPHRRQAMGEL